MKTLIMFLFIIALSSLSNDIETATVNQHWGNHPKDELIREWNCILINLKGVRVIYLDELGMRHEEECIGVWESSTQFKLTWKDSKTIILQKSNVTGMKYTIIAD